MKKGSGEGICLTKVGNIENSNLLALIVVVFMGVVKMERLGCIQSKFFNGIRKLVVKERNENLRFLARSAFSMEAIWLLPWGNICLYHCQIKGKIHW